jgi:hypothetical protein
MMLRTFGFSMGVGLFLIHGLTVHLMSKVPFWARHGTTG